jgi:hypothetical protein
MSQNWEQAIASIVYDFKLNGRMKLRVYPDPSEWGWVISPVRTYLETGDIGPVPVREVEWVELDLTKRRHLPRGVGSDDPLDVAEVIAALTEFQTHFDPETSVLRVFPTVG